VAIVTGGASGIGRATAFEFAKMGARVVVADLHEEHGGETVRELQAAGHTAIYRRTDVTSPEQLTLLVAHAVEVLGRLDVMFNNAGVASGGPMLDWTPEQYDRVVAVNQNGVFYGMQAAARAMRDKGRGGVIINTGSVFGELASRHCIGYQATKAAVEVMTKVAAHELAQYGIRVVNVAPGVVDTAMTEDYRRAGLVETMARKHMRGALLRPEAVARVVAFLATDAASAVNGTTVFADDGYSAFK
jgi:NAD(P)-dependent dehydrogenase (short-subunit alcohol dehydrogenase family)